MGYRLGVELEDDWVTDPIRVLDSFLGIAGGSGLDGRDAVGGEELLGLGFGEEGAALVSGGLYQLPGGITVGVVVVGERGGLVEAAQIVGIAPHVVKDAGGGIRVVKGWNARL